MLEVPDFETALNESFFSRQARVVAPDLLGRILVRQFDKDSYNLAKIVETAAWQGMVDSSRETIKYNPGHLGISNRRGNYLIDIATGTSKSPSCVTIIAIDTEKGVQQGPGNVSDYLQVDSMFDNCSINHRSLWIGGEAIQKKAVKKRNLRNLPENCRGYFYMKA